MVKQAPPSPIGIVDLRRALTTVEESRSGDIVDVEQYVRGLTKLEALARELKKPAIKLLRASGRPWREIGDLVGVSSQAAWQRFKIVDEPIAEDAVAVTPDRMRLAACDQIARVTGGPVTRASSREQTYRTSNGQTFHLRTRARDDRNEGFVYWFGLQERFWNHGEFFVLACDLDFVLVVPIDDWMVYRDDICISMADTPQQARQPHIYWVGERYELRERDLVVDVRPWKDRFDLLVG